MLSEVKEYLINDITELRFKYLPQLQCWESVEYRRNNVNQIVTVCRLDVENDVIKARMQQFKAGPMNYHNSNLRLVDTKEIEFENNDFLNSLKNAKND